MDCFLLEVFDSRGSSDQQVEINLSADALRLLLQQTDVNRVIDKVRIQTLSGLYWNRCKTLSIVAVESHSTLFIQLL